jgi:hypothetical protein
MTPELLRRICTAYNPRTGQTNLAAALDISDRTMRRWLAGEAQAPAGMEPEISRALRSRLKEIDGQRTEIIRLLSILGRACDST